MSVAVPRADQWKVLEGQIHYWSGGTNETLVLAHHYHMPNTKSKCLLPPN
jgi:hypothetical protein